VNNKIRVYWDVIFCSQTDRYQCVEEAAGSVFCTNNPANTYPKSVWVKHAGRKGEMEGSCARPACKPRYR